MKTISSLTLLILILANSTSCTMAILKRPNPRFDIVKQVSSLPEKIFIKEFNAGNKEIEKMLNGSTVWCRASSIHTPKDKTVGQYIIDTINADLKAAEKYDENGISVTLTVHEIDSNSNKGFWVTDFEYTVQQIKYRFKKVYEFEASFGGYAACNAVIDHLPEAISANALEFYQVFKTSLKNR